MLKPLPGDAWNYNCAAHLLFRAGFGGTPKEIQRLLTLGHRGAVEQLVEYESISDPSSEPEWAAPDPERAEKLRKARQASPEARRQLLRAEQQVQRRHLLELRAWWLERMTHGSRPLQEKMTLFWHGHFATSIEKVREARLMWRQNELFRRMATGKWFELLEAVSKDPAMLIWLDQAQSRKEHPNENFARELMELFTLGEGHYTERDINEAARALTGWSYDRVRQEFVERPYFHDSGEKKIFGREGRFDGEDLLHLVLGQARADEFICAKIWKFFAGTEPGADLKADLAQTFRSAGQEFKPLLRAIFLSEAFYSPSVIGNQVKSPVEWLVGSVKLLECPLPPPAACSALTRTLGQELFAPPNVKGWDGGLAWINTNSLMTRYNQVHALVYRDGSALRNVAASRGLKPGRFGIHRNNADIAVSKLVSEEDRPTPSRVLEALQRRFLRTPLKAKQQRTMQEFLETNDLLRDEVLLSAVSMILCTPEYQLC